MRLVVLLTFKSKFLLREHVSKTKYHADLYNAPTELRQSSTALQPFLQLSHSFSAFRSAP